MTSHEARQRLPQIDDELAIAQTELRDRRLSDAKYAHDEATLGRPRDGAEHAHREDLKEARRLLLDGATSRDGIPFRELVPLVGKPGIRQLERLMASLEAERPMLLAYLDRWPDDTTTHLYRYTGPRFKAQFDGRFLEPGDIVELNESRAAAWADRFEAVEEIATS